MSQVEFKPLDLKNALDLKTNTSQKKQLTTSDIKSDVMSRMSVNNVDIADMHDIDQNI